jgi:MFS family permease
MKTRNTGNMVAGLGSLRWWMLGLLVLAMVVSYIDRGNISMAMPVITDVFDLNAKDKGYVFSIFLLSYTLMQIPSGRLVDRFGIKWTYAVSYLAWCLIAACFGFTTVLWQLLVLRFMLGVTESISGPAGNAYVAAHFGQDRRGFASGLLVSGSKIGPAAGAVIAGLLIDSYGWRMLFILCGLVPLLWLLPWLVLYRKQERIEKSIPSGPDKTIAGEGKVQGGITLLQLMQHRKTWGIFSGYFFYGYVWFLYISWLPSYLYEVLGFSIKETGWWAGFAYGCLAVVVILAGYAADYLIKKGNNPTRVRKGFIMTGFLFGSLILPVPFIDNPVYAVTMVVITISGMGLATANTWAITQSVAPAGTVGTLAGIQNFGATFGGFIAPVVTGFLIKSTGSYTPAFVLAGLCMLAGIACYHFLIGKVEMMEMKKIRREEDGKIGK